MNTESPDLALSRWGLRFSSAATEAEYWRWRIQNAAPSTRVAIVAGLIIWSAALGAVYVGIPERFATAAWSILIFVVPMHVACFALTYRSARWAVPLGSIVDGVAGFVAVGVALGVADSLGVAVAGATLAAYFALTVFRLPPAYAVTAVIPYILFTVYLVTAAYAAGEIDRAELTGFLVIPVMAAISGAYVTLEIERDARATFRNERIIEHQQRALDEEHANLSRFLSPEVTRLVRERGIEGTLLQHTLPITVVCSDLRGFTAYTERFGAGLMATVLRDYYDTVVDVAKKYDGTVKDFAGDGAMVLVGAPLTRTDHAAAGVALARDLEKSVMALTDRYSTPEAVLGVGIGVATACARSALSVRRTAWNIRLSAPR